MEGSLLTSPTRRSAKDQDQTLVRERGNHHLPLGQRQRCLGAGAGRGGQRRVADKGHSPTGLSEENTLMKLPSFLCDKEMQEGKTR